VDSLAGLFTSVKWFFVYGSFFILIPAFLVGMWFLFRSRKK
jgi:flagellar biogenesis protein FliO